MVIIKGVPNTREVLDKTHHAWKEAAKNPEAYECVQTFAVSTNVRKKGKMFDRMNNVFPLGEETALNNARALGISRDDCFDLLGRQQPLDIPGVDYAQVERDFTSHGRELALKLLSIFDHHRGHDRTSLRSLTEASETQKYRHIFIMPDDVPVRDAEQILWHFDQVFCSVLFKDRFYVRDGDDFKEVSRPNDSGLQIRKADGTDHYVALEDDEVLIQGGVSLQILTGNEFKA